MHRTRRNTLASVRTAFMTVLLAAPSCRQVPATQLVIRVDSDLNPGTEIQGFRIHVEREGLKPNEQVIVDQPYYLLGTNHLTLPIELGVVPHNTADDRRLRVVVTANPGSTDTFSQTAIVSFRPEHISLLTVFLAKKCAIPSIQLECEAKRQTCGRNGECIDINRPDLPDLQQDAGLDTAQDATMLDPGDAFTLPFRGGTGGSAYTLPCNANEVAVGIAGRSGQKIDNIGLRCAVLQSNGSLAGVVRDTAQTGGDGGSVFSDLCPAGQFVVGLYGTSGVRVEQLGVYCALVNNWIATGTGFMPLPSHGQYGTTPFDDKCPVGYVLTSLAGRSGTLVDAIQGQCVRVSR